MKVKTFGRAVAVGLGTILVATLALASPASADPPPGDFRTIAGVGSDTTQDVVNGLGEVVGDGDVMASYDARGSENIQTKPTGCVFPRPNGSTDGRRALRASQGEDIGQGGPGFWQGVNITGCVEFARSSSYGGGTVPSSVGNYTYIPVGVDALALAINSNSDLPRNWSFARVQRVYKCFDELVAGLPVTPLLVQSGSGTRQFWLQRMEITEQEITLGDYPCLEDLDNNVQEHDGTVLTGHNEYIVPIGAGPYLSQVNSAAILAATGVTVVDRHGPAILTGMSTTTQATTQPIVGGILNINFPLRRDVYHVVPTNELADPTIAATFVGPNSDVCTATVDVDGTPTNVVQLFGFGIRTTFIDPLQADCGYTNLRFNS